MRVNLVWHKRNGIKSKCKDSGGLSAFDSSGICHFCHCENLRKEESWQSTIFLKSLESFAYFIESPYDSAFYLYFMQKWIASLRSQ